MDILSAPVFGQAGMLDNIPHSSWEEPADTSTSTNDITTTDADTENITVTPELPNLGQPVTDEQKKEAEPPVLNKEVENSIEAKQSENSVEKSNGEENDTELDFSNMQEVPELTEEEKNLMNLLHPTVIQHTKIHCTACNKHLGSSLNNQIDRFVHPMLKVLVCRSCLEFYMSGEFEKDEDGSELYCRWCGQGGKVLCCTKCAFVFCQKCIRHNMGKKGLDGIKNSDDWLCFACNPAQTVNLRINCFKIFKYIHNEKERVKLLNDPDLYNKDYSLCCTSKQNAASRKRKSSDNDDSDFDIEKNIIYTKVRKPAIEKDPLAWKPEGEEEEVVCAPDLSLFMDEDENPDESNDVHFVNAVPPANLVNSRHQQPPVNMKHIMVPNPLSLNVTKPLLHTPRPQFIRASFPRPVSSTPVTPFLPAYKPVQVRRVPLQNSVPQALPPLKLISGLRHEWFDSTARVAAKVHSTLSQDISALSKDQTTATTIEDLAKIHNKFQEVLSSSINSLIQIRRNLRSEFLSSLNKLKFSRNNNVAIVNSGANIAETIDLVDKDDGVAKPVRAYLKVRSVAQLSNLPPECITIPDDGEKEKETSSSSLFDSPVVTTKDETAKNVDGVNKICDSLENSDSNKENLENFSRNGEGDGANNTSEEPLTEEIRRALFESKIEKMILDNLKYKCDGISLKELKYMLSARVYVKSAPRKPVVHKSIPCELQDFEEVLNGSVVMKPKVV